MLSRTSRTTPPSRPARASKVSWPTSRRSCTSPSTPPPPCTATRRAASPPSSGRGRTTGGATRGAGPATTTTSSRTMSRSRSCSGSVRVRSSRRRARGVARRGRCLRDGRVRVGRLGLGRRPNLPGPVVLLVISCYIYLYRDALGPPRRNPWSGGRPVAGRWPASGRPEARRRRAGGRPVVGLSGRGRPPAGLVGRWPDWSESVRRGWTASGVVGSSRPPVCTSRHQFEDFLACLYASSAQRS